LLPSHLLCFMSVNFLRLCLQPPTTMHINREVRLYLTSRSPSVSINFIICILLSKACRLGGRIGQSLYFGGLQTGRPALAERPHRLWSPQGLLSNDKRRITPNVKRPGRGAGSPPLSSTEVNTTCPHRSELHSFSQLHLYKINNEN
jgi:hypothetical protein